MCNCKCHSDDGIERVGECCCKCETKRWTIGKGSAPDSARLIEIATHDPDGHQSVNGVYVRFGAGKNEKCGNKRFWLMRPELAKLAHKALGEAIEQLGEQA